MQHRENDKKVVEQLLSSGLPLEQIVAEKLTMNQSFVCGPYSYPRYNEHQIDTEFSVDIKAFELTATDCDTYWGSIDLLVECKYCHAGVTWVFAPHPNQEATIAGVITVLDDLSVETVDDKQPLLDFDNDLIFCIRGISLSSKQTNTGLIAEGLSQLRYAMPYFV